MVVIVSDDDLAFLRVEARKDLVFVASEDLAYEPIDYVVFREAIEHRGEQVFPFVVAWRSRNDVIPNDLLRGGSLFHGSFSFLDEVLLEVFCGVSPRIEEISHVVVLADASDERVSVIFANACGANGYLVSPSFIHQRSRIRHDFYLCGHLPSDERLDRHAVIVTVVADASP
jgi:hypothetical protein